MVLQAFGKNRLVDDLVASDFEALRESLSKRFGPTALANRITWIRGVFRYAYEAGLIDKPVRVGPTFKAPKKRILRAARQAKGPMLFEAREIRRLLKAASPQLRAMIYLGINAGYGPTDCGRLPLSALDLRSGWINYPRPKTAVERRCPLWGETIEALKVAMAARPTAKTSEIDNLVFVTKYGDSWSKETADSPIGKEFAKLLRKLKLQRKGRAFYALRHGLQTIGDDAKDPVATRYLMGHSDPSMGGVYRERISDDRLVDVANHVRRWLFRRDSADLWQSRRERKGGV
jgi:integrase